MKTYVGELSPVGTRVFVREGDHVYRLDPRHGLRNHSPDGFRWGYGGSGPAQLALAILADATGDDSIACAVYQDFKFAVIAKLDGDRPFEMSQLVPVEFAARWPEGKGTLQ